MSIEAYRLLVAVVVKPRTTQCIFLFDLISIMQLSFVTAEFISYFILMILYGACSFRYTLHKEGILRYTASAMTSVSGSWIGWKMMSHYSKVAEAWRFVVPCSINCHFIRHMKITEKSNFFSNSMHLLLLLFQQIDTNKPTVGNPRPASLMRPASLLIATHESAID